MTRLASSPAAPPLPRADEPWSGEKAVPSEAPSSSGLFPFAPAARVSFPTACLLGYLFLGASAIDEEWQGIGALHPRLVLGLTALLAAAFRALAPSGVKSPHVARPAGVLLAAFLLAGAASAAFAFDTSLSIPAEEENATRVLGFFLVVGLCRTRRDVALAALALGLGAGFHLLRSGMEYAAGKHQFTMGVKRMLGAGTSYADPNSFAATVVLAFPLVLWTARASRSRLLKIAALCYGVLGAACVVLTHSRGGLVLLAVAALWAVSTISGRLARVSVGVLLVGLGVLLFSGLTPNEAKRFAGLTSVETLTTDESAHGRIEGYEVSWRIFQENPVLGVGPGCWSAYRQRKVDGNRHEPHTLAGQLIATLGAVGTAVFLAYLAAVVAAARRLRRERKDARDPYGSALRGLAGAVLVTLLLLFVSGLAAHNLDRPAWYLLPALLFALAAAPPTPATGSAPATAAATARIGAAR